MLLAPSVSCLFKWRQFQPEVILFAVGWYLRFSLSYRDVEELMAERDVHADHVTVWRWVQRYASNNVLEQDHRAIKPEAAPVSIFVHSGELGARSPATRRSI